jgi:hypothetical protein
MDAGLVDEKVDQKDNAMVDWMVVYLVVELVDLMDVS